MPIENGAWHRPKNLVSQTSVKQEKSGSDRHLWLKLYKNIKNDEKMARIILG